MSKKITIKKTSKERIESITIGDEKFSLHDEFDYADGGIILEILDNEMIRKEYEEGDWDVNESFYSMKDDKVVPFETVACKLVLRDSGGGYVYHFDVNGDELYED